MANCPLTGSEARRALRSRAQRPSGTLVGMDVEEARQRLTTLMLRLEKISDRDAEQEVRGIALPVIDAILNASRSLLKPGDKVGEVVRDLISPEAVADGDGEVRAVDALVVVEQLLRSLPPAPPLQAIPYDTGPDFMCMEF